MFMKVKLGDVCNILNGFSFKSDKYVDEGIRVIRITNVQKGYIDDEKPQFYPIGEIDNIKDYILRENDILLSLTGNVGRVAMLNKKFLPAALNQRVACLRNKESNILQKYLYYTLLSNKFENDCISSAKGIAQKNMSTEWLKAYEINIYIKEKQLEIINILDNLINIITARQQQLQKLDELVKARFVEMFGDPVSNPHGLRTKKLSELGVLERGRSQHRPRNAPELLNGPYPLIQTGEVASAWAYITDYHSTYSELGLKQSKMWKAGTLCITIAANIAQTAIMTFDACFPDSVVGFVPNEEVNALYMHYWFGFFQKILEEQAPQVAQKNINLKILSDLNVIVPNQEHLKAFKCFVEQIDKSKVAVQKALDEAQNLFDSLMQEYFG